MSNGKNDAANTNKSPRVVIIGAGMSGIYVAAECIKKGYDVTVLEKKEEVGGTWRENTYPGIACDAPAHMYSYNFAPNAEYSNRFANGEEIQHYFKSVASDYGVRERTRFNQELTECRFIDNEWHLQTVTGDNYVADIIFLATGLLHHPVLPDIAGMDTFKGASWHTARWNHDIDLTGKKVGIIGTGSTAVQIVGAVVDKVEHLSVFQRTPQWILPLLNKEYTEDTKIDFRKNPGKMLRLHKIFGWVLENLLGRAVIGGRFAQWLVQTICRRNLETSIKDPILREKLRPDYAATCKRLVIADKYYDAIQQPQADLIDAGIDCIEEQGVRTKDGKLHELDVLVYSTGFDTLAFMNPAKIYGENGAELGEKWGKAPYAHRSLTVPDFPNMFTVVGPHSPIGNYSFVGIVEWQLWHIFSLIEKWQADNHKTFQPKKTACKNYNQQIVESAKHTMWAMGGCNSWYLDENGVPLSYPWSLKKYRREMAQPDFSEYEFSD